MTREGRLQPARTTAWARIDAGKNPVQTIPLVRGRCPVRPVTELRRLGLVIDDVREKQVRATLDARTLPRSRDGKPWSKSALEADFPVYRRCVGVDERARSGQGVASHHNNPPRGINVQIQRI